MSAHPMLHLQSGFWVSAAHDDTHGEYKKKAQWGGGRGGEAVQWAVAFSSSAWKLGNCLLKWRLSSLGILLEGYKY